MSGQALSAAVISAIEVNLTSLASDVLAFQTALDGVLAGAADVNASFTLSSGYLVRCTSPMQTRDIRS